ncbi:hypothetical protein OKW76_12605 [Sphingomonas sp. S1-29]|uniref:hypothetical protein n=1 Tax=Sphingomonas sp. S1-29 TaxID=2991074 RepID=UPI00223F04A7|nr:hypothetical protein [Sphingomonas sp. S1-29]UZK68867.1 hypothetical protein OKW76_12605 [Sphingomonas sp. S1-29]
MIRFLLIPVALLALSACGSRGRLEPAPGKTLPVAPYGAQQAPNADELLTSTSQQRPVRSDELLTTSEERPNDPFALPPR